MNLIDQRHDLVRLAELIDWQAFSDQWSPQFTSTAATGASSARVRVISAREATKAERRPYEDEPR